MFDHDSRASARDKGQTRDGQPGNATKYQAKEDSVTVRTHKRGLARESMKMGETFIGTDQGGWVWGQSEAGITGWVLRSSLKQADGRENKNKRKNPAGAPRKDRTVGKPEKDQYVGSDDLKQAWKDADAQAVAKGQPKPKHEGKPAGFSWSTSCTMHKDARVFRDIHLRQPYEGGGTAVTLKAGQPVSVRYVQGKAACIFLDGNWWFVAAGAVDRANLDARLRAAKQG